MRQVCENSIGRLLYLTTMASRKYLDFRLRPYGLTSEQFRVLKRLYEYGGGVSQSQIATGLAKSPANITRILDRLEAKSWLERRSNPEDRRSSLIFLTAEGTALIDRVRRDLADAEQRVIADIPENQLEAIRQGLLSMQKNIQQNLTEGEKDEDA